LNGNGEREGILMAEEIGFIGLGNMGVPMATALIDSGFRLTVYNRTAAKAAPLAAKGARVAGSLGEAIIPGGIVVTMLADDAALEDVVTTKDGIAARLGPGGVHLSMSTVSPESSRRMAELLGKTGARQVSAPVIGRPDRAAARRLWIIASGPAAARERVLPLLDAMGQKTYEFGEDPGAANIVKLINNFMITAAIEAISEALALAQKTSIEPVALARLLTESLFSSPLYQGYFDVILNRRFSPAGFRMVLGLKDIGLVLNTASEARVPMPMASVIRDRVVENLARGRAELDWAAIALGALEDAGIKV
jgi:3-hydroxyisobutyrate dehydrogenase-like beta-hydroxyacid dehydrogenase